MSVCLSEACAAEACPTPFETSAAVDQLLPALITAQAAIKPAVKGAENDHFRRKYADLSDVWESCREPLHENRFAVLYPLRSDGEDTIVTVVLWHESGQWVRSWLRLKADTKRPQEVGSGITYFRRYLLASLLAISTQDDDGEAAMRRQEGRRGKDRDRGQERDQRRREVNEAFPQRGQEQRQGDDCPRSGKGLFAWCKEREQELQIGLLKWLNGWGKLQEFPARMVDWDRDQVALAYSEACRKIQAIRSGSGTKPVPQEPEPEARPESHHEPSQPAVTTKQVKRFESDLNAFCQRANVRWIDKHTDGNGDIPSWVVDLINPYQLVNHMLKEAGVQLPDGGNFGQRMKAAAGLWVSDEAKAAAGWRTYVKSLADTAEAEHAGTADADLETTEAGVRG